MEMKYLVLAVSLFIALNNCPSLAQKNEDSLLPGGSLAGNQTITSKNGTFALGFFCPNGTNNWYVGIWYVGIFPRVIVWVANRDNPMKIRPGVLKFSGDRYLRLFDTNGRSVWSPDIGPKGSRAVMMDSGNLIILGDVRKTSEIVWESFAHPGNTWLPGMKFWNGMKVTSWKSSTDPATGLFSLGPELYQGKVQLVMTYNNSFRYWSSGEWTGSYFSSIPEGMYYTNRYIISLVRVSPSTLYFFITINPWANVVRGLEHVDENGVFTVYFGMYDGTWSTVWENHRGQCNLYNICGSYGLCNANAVCSCIAGFTPKNDSQSFLSSGCTRRKPLKCSVKAGTTDGFIESKNRDLPEEEFVSYIDGLGFEGCRTACLNNCSCTAFAFSISDQPACKLWYGDLLKMSVSSDNHSIFIRLAASELPVTASERSKKALLFVISLPSVTAFFVFFALLMATFILWKRRRLRKKRIEEVEDLPITLKMFTYKELRSATGNFKHKLGSGAFGSVFKGTLPGNTLVAVKRLEGSGRAEKQFLAEINTIGNLKHVNLVRLYGFCVEGSRRLLVYEYMPNGSLNLSLFTKEKEPEKVLDWKTRFQIALGTARGLLYLHEECRDRIIHSDIKPENILLDVDLNPKIADFGLAKLVGREFSHVLTTTRGTPGYLAPEWISGVPITPKVDVYSFGMTLLEIISGRRNLDLTVEERSRLYYPTWALSQVPGCNIIGIVDARIASETNIEELQRVVVVGGLCIQDNENERPSMSEVLNILEGSRQVSSARMSRCQQTRANHIENSESYTFSSSLSSLKSNIR